ncbi:hypothetical protein GE061_007765 [Apolygus lucorum]|uniref:Uncharacterized protein n=1 Tax=Apolygus lucorum TaxID=248454 RepID=A0A8S9WLM1_APOLU|nr:hypothetical protein GE061_007765 [Apolygus lucorum]
MIVSLLFGVFTLIAVSAVDARPSLHKRAHKAKELVQNVENKYKDNLDQTGIHSDKKLKPASGRVSKLNLADLSRSPRSASSKAKDKLKPLSSKYRHRPSYTTLKHRRTHYLIGR